MRGRMNEVDGLSEGDGLGAIQSTGFDRRAFIARATAGVGAAGLVWSAPAILRSDAAFGCPAGSPCTPTLRLDWSTQTTCGSPASVVVGAATILITTSGTGAGDCFDVRKTASDGCDPGGATPNFPRGLPTVPPTGPTFNQADDDFYSLYKNASGGAVSVTFSFTNTAGGAARPVNGVTFAIGDIDENTPGFPLNLFTNYTDRVTITAVDDAGVALSAATVASSITVTKGTSPPSGGNPFVGTGTLISDSAATVVVAFGCLIRSFTVTFDNIATSPAGPQWIAISDILWCA